MGKYALSQFQTEGTKVGRYGLPDFAPQQDKPSGLQFNIPKGSANSTMAVAPEGTGKSTGDFIFGAAGDVLRAAPRAAASALLPAIGVDEFKPETRGQKLLLGKEPVKSIPTRIAEADKQLEKVGVFKPVAKGLAPPLILGLTALDLLPGLPGKKKVTEEVAKKLIARYGDDVAKQIIIKGPKIAEQALAEGGEQVVKKLSIEAPRVAGNIRLDKFDLPKQSLDDLAKIIEENDAFVAQRRGVQTFADTEALAQEAKVPTKLKAGKALNAEELQSLGNHIAYTRTQLDDVAKRIVLGDNTDLALLKQAEVQTKMGALLASYSGATAEAGRSLSILRNLRKAIGSNDPEFIKQAMKALGGRDKIEEIANRLASFADDDLLGKYRFVRSLQKPGAIDWANWYWYTNLLSGPKTQVRNIVGNVSNLTTGFFTKSFAASSDYLRHFVTGKEREIFLGEVPSELHGVLAGIKDGWKKAHFIMKNGFTLDDVAQLDFKPPEVAGGIYTNLIGRSLEAADQFFRSVAASGELHAQAYAAAKKQALKGEALKDFYTDFITNPPVSAMKSVSRFGARGVFRQEAGKIMNAVVKLKNDFDIKLPSGKTVKVFNPMKFVMPFVSTPANIIKSSLEYTPAGFFSSFFKETAREQSQALGKAAFGSIALAPLALMAAEGRISGSGPKDKELRDLLYSSGWQPNSIRIGDKWYTYSNFQPLALPLSIMANAFELHHYEGEEVNPVAIVGKTANSLFQQSYLSGLSALQDALENPETFGKAFANRFLTSVLPASSLRGQLARAEDEVVRSPQTVGESIKASVPGLSDEVRPRLNVFGEESTRDTGLPQPLEFLSNFLSPVDVRAVKDSPLSKELMRLKDDIQIGFPSKSFTIGNVKIELTPDEQNEYLKESGSRIKSRLETAVGSQAWASRSDEGKAKFIKKVIEVERDRAKKLLVRRSDRIKDQIKQSRREGRETTSATL